jgi:signal transduction histidine kinase
MMAHTTPAQDSWSLPATHTRKVLLVEEDAVQLERARVRLSGAGFEVAVAHNAKEALQKAFGELPDVVVSDVLVGVGVGGLGLCRMFRQEPSLAAIPIVLLAEHAASAPEEKLASVIGAFALVARTPEFTAELDAVRRIPGAPLKAVEDVEEAAEPYRSLSLLPEVLWTRDAGGELLYVEGNVAKVCGATPAALTAGGIEAWISLLDPRDMSRVREAYHELMVNGKLFDIEYRLNRPSSRPVWLRDRALAVHDQDGQRQAEGILADVSESKRVEEQLRQSQKMEAMGQLTCGIAHDFNNIIATILANSLLLLEETRESGAGRSHVDEIKAAAERATALTRQLLAFSRRQVNEPQLVDVNAVILSVENMLQRVLNDQVRLSTELQKDLGMVRADAGQIEQILMNLVVNARDAMPAGGIVDIATKLVDLDEQEAAQHFPLPPGRYVLLEVSDTGVGMDAETKRRAFQPFFTTKPKGKGTGLGLSTCYGIVKKCAGHIELESAPSRGTVFRIYLPRAKLAASTSL